MRSGIADVFISGHRISAIFDSVDHTFPGLASECDLVVDARESSSSPEALTHTPTWKASDKVLTYPTLLRLGHAQLHSEERQQ